MEKGQEELPVWQVQPTETLRFVQVMDPTWPSPNFHKSKFNKTRTVCSMTEESELFKLERSSKIGKIWWNLHLAVKRLTSACIIQDVYVWTNAGLQSNMSKHMVAHTDVAWQPCLFIQISLKKKIRGVSGYPRHTSY